MSWSSSFLPDHESFLRCPLYPCTRAGWRGRERSAIWNPRSNEIFSGDKQIGPIKEAGLEDRL